MGQQEISKTSLPDAKVTQARQRHQEALTAYVNATKGVRHGRTQITAATGQVARTGSCSARPRCAERQ